MNEELQKALTEILSGVLTAKDFVLAELPEVLTQLLLWKFWHSLIIASLGVVVLICVLHFMTVYIKKVIDLGKTNDDYYLWLIPMSIIGIPISMAAFISINITWLQIWVAPKVYLIEYAASLTK